MKYVALAMDDARAETWEHIFGENAAPVVSPIPSRGHVPGHVDTLIYQVDLEDLNDEQRARLVTHLADVFEYDEAYVEENLEDIGVPIIAQDVVIKVEGANLFWF